MTMALTFPNLLVRDLASSHHRASSPNTFSKRWGSAAPAGLVYPLGSIAPPGEIRLFGVPGIPIAQKDASGELFSVSLAAM